MPARDKTQVHSRRRSRTRRRGRPVIALMLALSIGAAAYLGYLGASELLERQAGDSYYDRLSASISDRAPVIRSTSPEESRTGAVDGENIPAEEAERAAQPSATGSDSAGGGQHASAAEEAPEPSAVDFAALRETCPDVVGWIAIDGTCIDYPVVQGDDNAYYLKHLPDGTANSAGSIMMDAACDAAFGNDVTILHGHHMRSGAMFGDLDEYQRAEYYEAHPTIRLYTPEGDRIVDVFAACTVNGATFGYPTVFSDEEAFRRFVDGLVSASAFDAGVEVEYGDRLLLLSTCAYSFESARFVVVGRIRQAQDASGTEEGEGI